MTQAHFLLDDQPIQLTTGAGVSNENRSTLRSVLVSFEVIAPNNNDDWIELPAGAMFPRGMSVDGLWVKCLNASASNPAKVCEYE